MYSYSYKFKAQFYRYLDLDSDTKKLIKKFNYAKDEALQGKTVYFITKETKDEIQGRR